jgi:hypothetical protein
MGLGAVLALVGLVIPPSAATNPDATTSTTASVVTPSTGAVGSSTTLETTVTTLGGSTTTTAVAAPETVESFVAEFSAALAAGNADFIYGRIHPLALEAYGADTCRTWVQTQVMTLSDYQLAGPATGPLDQPLPTPTGTITVPDTFVAPVTFLFESQKVRAQVGFAPIDGKIYWLGRCR